MWSAARSMAPRAMKYDFVSSTAVAARSVSPRTLPATARAMAESAASSQRTMSRAEPRRRAHARGILLPIEVGAPCIAVDRQRGRYRGYVQRRGGTVEGRHFDSYAQRQQVL